jgi:ABC-type glutathione transport system ATPase component
MKETLLELESLVKHFPIPAGGLLRRKYNTLKAVDGVNFCIPKGTCFGIAGESGSGKTTIIKLVLLKKNPRPEESFSKAGTLPLLDGRKPCRIAPGFSQSSRTLPAPWTRI